VDAASRARSRGPQVHAACDAGAIARCLEPGCRRLSLGARLFPEQGLHGRPLRAVLLTRLHRRRPLRGRGCLRTERVVQDRHIGPQIFWRYGSLGLSVVLYISCLSVDAFCASSCHAGYSILLSGPFGLLISFTNWIWLANPLLFGAWIALAFGQNIDAAGSGLVALLASLMALVIALSFLFAREVVMN